ncbi:MAG: Crp/Fnr family transcriptional regulator, partial [Novosphingobium sp.]
MSDLPYNPGGHAAICKLLSLADLREDDCALYREVLMHRIKRVPSRTDVVHEGDCPRAVRVMLDGWACRYKELPDGRRQILAFFVPGDLCDSAVFLLDQMDHSIAAITPVTIAEITPDIFTRMTRESPELADALALSELVTVAIQREWTLGLGQRTARERVSHLLCELHARLEAVGLGNDGECDMPLTQADIGSATGLTPIHVNRVLQDLRREGIIDLARRRLRIRRPGVLGETAMFDPTYLHLRRPPLVVARPAPATYGL